MKFLCEQCKAKYQIADDKVAGKTVRMKCRKCGHMIEVRAEVTETSVAQGLPEEGKPKPGTKPAVAKTGLATSLTARPPPPKGRPDALAGAFKKTVREDGPESTASIEMLDSAATNGWYVAINGVPVGPIRVSELRRKAANGAVTEDSLVWREGLEEWRPVRSVTEIAEIVREAMTSGRPSLVTPPPADVHGTGRTSSLLPPAPSHGAAPAPRAPARPAAPRAPEAPRQAPIAARSNVVPFTGRLATAEKREEAEDIDIEEEFENDPPIVPPAASSSAAIAAMAAPANAAAALPERPSMITSDPFAVPTTLSNAAPSPAFMPSAPAAPAAAAPVAASAQSSVVASVPIAPIAVGAPVVVAEPPRRQTNWIALGMIAAFIAFGITGAIVAFRKDPVAPQPTIIQVPVPMQPNAPQATAPTEQPQDVGDLDPKSPTKGPVAKGPSNAGKTTTPNTPQQGGGIKGLDGLLGPNNGPTVGPGGPGPSRTSSELSSDQIEATVRNYSPAVKRKCWDGASSSSSSVNINAKVVIASTGQVQSVETSGNEPAIAKCIDTHIHGWRFPASSGTSTVNIPFKFLRQ